MFVRYTSTRTLWNSDALREKMRTDRLGPTVIKHNKWSTNQLHTVLYYILYGIEYNRRVSQSFFIAR